MRMSMNAVWTWASKVGSGKGSPAGGCLRGSGTAGGFALAGAGPVGLGNSCDFRAPAVFWA